MGKYDATQIANLAGQLGGDPKQAAQRLQQMGGQIDPQKHGDALRAMGIDPQKLQNGDYQQHLDAQNEPGFRSGMGQGMRSGMSRSDMGQTDMGRSDMSQGDPGGQNFQQFDQDQGGMRGMKPDPSQQLSDDRRMAGRQSNQMAGQQSGKQGRQQSRRQSGRRNSNRQDQ